MTHGAVLALTHTAATTQQVAFWLLAVISVSAALGMILARKAVYCAVLLAVVMLCLAVLYALLGAPFLAFVQVIVYTGAVLMLFLFVLMIVGIRAKDSIVETLKGQRVAAGLAGIGLLVLLSLTIGHAVIGPAPAQTAAFGAANVNAIARLIFTTYVFPFEVTSALLITAALGAMVLAHRERAEPKLTQRDLSRLRMAGSRPAPLPGPGTYARHNAVDMPALLPDGTPAQDSVSPFISHRIQPPAVTAGEGMAGEGTAGEGTAGETAAGPDQERTLLGSGPAAGGPEGDQG
ncbi:MAG TPA: NADH-quinone oxidoreductase subunit J [Streptosporangiaceae bacterium]|nr:NADH-quinone oxidoreductase subunit J [Streptosporangiaceae bacterium]